MLIQRYEQFGSPVYVWFTQKIFTGSYVAILSDDIQSNNNGPLDYIERNGMTSFLHNFVVKGFTNISLTLVKLTLPYLSILVLFGVILSFKKDIFDKKVALCLKRSCKKRVSDKNKRLYSKKFRRLWFWQEDRWNQRHELNQKM